MNDSLPSQMHRTPPPLFSRGKSEVIQSATGHATCSQVDMEYSNNYYYYHPHNYYVRETTIAIE